MKLFVDDVGEFHDPSEAEIIRALNEAPDEIDNIIAILSRDDLTYIQTTGTRAEGFILEYQENSTEEHYASPERLTLEQVSRAFVAYATGDPSWLMASRWKKVKFIGRMGQATLVLIAMVVATCLVWLYWKLRGS